MLGIDSFLPDEILASKVNNFGGSLCIQIIDERGCGIPIESFAAIAIDKREKRIVAAGEFQLVKGPGEGCIHCGKPCLAIEARGFFRRDGGGGEDALLIALH